MGTVLSFIKTYFLLSFIMLIISYLSPKETYRKYFQFFVGILMAIVLFKPILTWDYSPEKIKHDLEWDTLNEQIQDIYYEEKNGVSIFETEEIKAE